MSSNVLTQTGLLTQTGDGGGGVGAVFREVEVLHDTQGIPRALVLAWA